MKYCEQCGTPLEDDAVACSNCGAPTGVQPAEAPVANEQPVAETVADATAAPADETATDAVGTPGDIKKVLPAIIAAGVACVVLFIIVIALLAGGGNKKPVESAVKLVNKKETNVDKYAKVALPGFAYKYYKTVSKIVKKTDMYEDYNDEFKDKLDDTFDDFADEYGKNWKIKFVQSKKEKLDKDDLDDIQEMYEDLYDDYLEDLLDELEDLDDDDIEDLADELDIKEKEAKKLVNETIKFIKKFEKVKVTAGYELKGKFEIKGKEDDDKSDSIKVTVIKLNGDWTIDYLSLMDEMGLSPRRLMNMF